MLPVSIMIPSDLLKKLDHNSIYQDALAKIHELLPTIKSRVIIGIGGIPGSGKSTLAEYICNRINLQYPNQVASVSMDGFHLSKAQLSAMADPEAAFARRGAPWTFDSESFVEHLRHFKQHPSKPLSWPSFDHAYGDPVFNGSIIEPNVKILIVEGLYVLHQQHGFEKASEFLDFRWFIHLELEHAMTQLALRHQQAWGISAEEAKRRILTNDALNAQIANLSQQYADHILHII